MKGIEVLCVALCSVDAIAWTALVSASYGMVWLIGAFAAIWMTRRATA